MVDLGGYVIILVETKDKRVKLYGKLIIYKQNKLRNDIYSAIVISLFTKEDVYNIYRRTMIKQQFL